MLYIDLEVWNDEELRELARMDVILDKLPRRVRYFSDESRYPVYFDAYTDFRAAYKRPHPYNSGGAITGIANYAALAYPDAEHIEVESPVYRTDSDPDSGWRIVITQRGEQIKRFFPSSAYAEATFRAEYLRTRS